MIERNDYLITWERCLAFIADNVNEKTFKTWFAPIKPVSQEGQVITVRVPNKFFYEWLEEHYVALLKMAVHRELGEQARLEYQILLDGNQTRKEQSKINAGNSLPKRLRTEEIKNPFVIPGIKRIKINSNLRKDYTFPNFIEGDCNKLARSAGLAIGQKPGSTAFNPLVIFGNVGLGKTHLAQAIGNEVLAHRPNKRVVYVSSEKFTNQIIESIKNNSVSDFVNFYQMMDVLIIDDIQFLANKVKTQEIFFHIFNQLLQNDKQIVLTSDRPPNEMEGMEKRLLSRFKWGLTADLQEPDMETRMAILMAKAQQSDIELPANVLEFICYNIKDNIRELEGVLVSIIAQSRLNEKKIDLDLAKVVLRNFISESKSEITIEFIEKIVSQYYNIEKEKLRDKTRKRNVVVARQTGMYLAKNYTDMSLKSIGDYFGGRDHSTVIYSINTVEGLMGVDEKYSGEVKEIEKKLQMSFSYS